MYCKSSTLMWRLTSTSTLSVLYQLTEVTALKLLCRMTVGFVSLKDEKCSRLFVASSQHMQVEEMLG